jgi:hypothetical protein
MHAPKPAIGVAIGFLVTTKSALRVWVHPVTTRNARSDIANDFMINC